MTIVWRKPPNRFARNRQTGLAESAKLYTETTAGTTAGTTLDTPPTPKSPPSPDAASGHTQDGGEKNPNSGVFGNAQEAENKTAKGDGSQSRHNTTSAEILLPDWLAPEDWNDYLEYRKGIRAPMSALAQKKAIDVLDRLKNEGSAPSQVINQSIVNGWKGLFPVKSAKDRQAGRQRPQTFDEIRREKNKQAFDAFLASNLSAEEEAHVINVP